MQSQAFDHEISGLELIETHISWLILAGDFAYKIKKPVVLDFVDFGTLEKRKYFCEEEIRLNRQWAPGIYLDVVPVTMEDGRPRFGGEGEVVEYAVRMRRFGDDLRLDRQLEAGLLDAGDMKELGAAIATRHGAAPRVDASLRDRVLALTQRFMQDNFVALQGDVDDAILDPVRQWTERELDAKSGLLAQRFDDGRVRDCHGDLHLGNLVRLSDGIATFDCIEFNADLRFIDVICDISFLVMDLVERGRPELAAHFINRYLEVTGDYGGVAVLRLFVVYRCMVRAKVASILASEREEPEDAERDRMECMDFCNLASKQIAPSRPCLVLMHGLSGSGKTWVSTRLMAALPAIRLRSDIERKRLFGIGELGASESAVGGGIYSDDASDAVYQRLFELAWEILASGYSVILDAAFLDRARRERAIAVAGETSCPAVIVDVRAPESVLRERLSARAAIGTDPSEASAAVLGHQLSTLEPLSTSEKARTVVCDNTGSLDEAELLARIKAAPGSGA